MSNGHKSKEAKQEPKKRKALVISSDEDDASVAESPQLSKSKKSKIPEKKGSPSPPNKKLKLQKLKNPSPKKESSKKPVDPMSLFGGETKRIEAKKQSKPKDKALLEFEDDEIDKSLMEIDLEESISESVKAAINGKDKKYKKADNVKAETKSSSPGKKKTVSPKKLEKSTTNEEVTAKKHKHSAEDENEEEEAKPKKKAAKEKSQDLETSK